MKKITLYAILLTSILVSGEKSKSFFTGNANFYYISKLEDGDIINMPYRMLNTSWINQHNNFELIGTLSMEYQPRDNYSYLMDNPQDFLFDLREFYLTWFTSFGEIRMGKQIQTWGFVDENSPIDNSCAYDYNFLFETGTDRKIGTNSISMDMYYKNLKFGFTASPFHQMNRLPSSKADFPIELPVIPSDYLFLDISSPNEFGGYLQLSTDIADIGISYFSGYDRIFNLSGINLFYTPGLVDTGEPVVDTVFTYRKTDVIGAGGAMNILNTMIRADIGYFSTKDLNSDIRREWPKAGNKELGQSYPLQERAKYLQTTLQIEYTLPYNINLLCQFFKHDSLEYKATVPSILEDEIDLPDFQADKFIPYDYFFPGMGSPLSLITHNAILIALDKSLFNDKLSIQLRNLKDLDYNGYFFEINSEYKLTNKISTFFAINYIDGDENHPNSISSKGSDYKKAMDYPFNQMDNFSHYRMQVKYSF